MIKNKILSCRNIKKPHIAEKGYLKNE